MATRPVDLGFAEFVSTLLSETVDAVVASLTGQEQQRAALMSAADEDLETFARANVADSEINELAARLFPSEDGGSYVAVGGPSPEPSDLQAIGVTLGKEDLADGELTLEGVKAIRSGLRLLLGQQRQEALREAVREGLPRVHVDEGKLLARLTFQTLHTASDEEDDTPHAVLAHPGLMAAVETPDSLVAAIPAAIRDVRLSVRPAAPGGASGQSESDLYGEVEIKFRTVY